MKVKFKNSPISEKILDFFSRKYSPVIAPSGLVKACSIASAKVFSERPKLNTLHIAPTRQWKSHITGDAVMMFPKKYHLYLGSDFTIFSLINEDKKEKINKKCLVINDGTILFETKQKRAKERLVGGLTEFL